MALWDRFYHCKHGYVLLTRSDGESCIFKADDVRYKVRKGSHIKLDAPLTSHQSRAAETCEHSGIPGTACDKDNCNEGCLY